MLSFGTAIYIEFRVSRLPNTSELTLNGYLRGLRGLLGLKMLCRSILASLLKLHPVWLKVVENCGLMNVTFFIGVALILHFCCFFCSSESTTSGLFAYFNFSLSMYCELIDYCTSFFWAILIRNFSLFTLIKLAMSFQRPCFFSTDLKSC